MKTPKPQKNMNALLLEKNDKEKVKNKMSPQTSKVNVKSNKFWNEHYDTGGDDFDKYVD